MAPSVRARASNEIPERALWLLCAKSAERRCRAALAYTGSAEGISARGGAWGGWEFPSQVKQRGRERVWSCPGGDEPGAEEFPASVTLWKLLAFSTEGKVLWTALSD